MWMLIPVAVVINGAIGWIIAKLNVPFYFDTIGTIFRPLLPAHLQVHLQAYSQI